MLRESSGRWCECDNCSSAEHCLLCFPLSIIKYCLGLGGKTVNELNSLAFSSKLCNFPIPGEREFVCILNSWATSLTKASFSPSFAFPVVPSVPTPSLGGAAVLSSCPCTGCSTLLGAAQFPPACLWFCPAEPFLRTQLLADLGCQGGTRCWYVMLCRTQKTATFSYCFEQVQLLLGCLTAVFPHNKCVLRYVA